MIKLLITVSLMVFFRAGVQSQDLPEWYRVLTLDDKSVVELNTEYVVFSTDKTGRVRLRWTFATPQPLKGERRVKFKRHIWEVECDCPNDLYRLRSEEFFDAGGKLVRAEERVPPGEWREVRHSRTMKHIFEAACRLIAYRRQNPPDEK